MKGYDFIIEDRIPIVVYDVSIDNMEERKKKAIEYKSMKSASQNLSLNYNVIKKSIVNRKRIYSPKLDKLIAIRYKKVS
jgi:hypothetical protein